MAEREQCALRSAFQPQRIEIDRCGRVVWTFECLAFKNFFVYIVCFAVYYGLVAWICLLSIPFIRVQSVSHDFKFES